MFELSLDQLPAFRHLVDECFHRGDRAQMIAGKHPLSASLVKMSQGAAASITRSSGKDFLGFEKPAKCVDTNWPEFAFLRNQNALKLLLRFQCSTMHRSASQSASDTCSPPGTFCKPALGLNVEVPDCLLQEREQRMRLWVRDKER